MKLSRDGRGGLAVLAASLLLFWQSFGLKENPLAPVGPGFYPKIVLGLTILLSAWLVAVDVYAKKPRVEKTPERLNYALVALQFGVFGLYCGALPFLGFRIATALYVAGANALLEPPRGVRGWLRVGTLAAGTAFITHAIFEHYLLVLLPRGSWTAF